MPGERVASTVMPHRLSSRVIARGTRRIPGLRRLPMLKLLAIAEIALVARDHLSKLEPAERRRLVQLVRKGRGRRTNLTDPEREELATLVAKAEPRLFVGLTADRLSPVPLPRRITHGPGKR